MTIDDLNDIDKEIKNAIAIKLHEAGQLAVRLAVEHGTYHDRTGRLRASNKYSVSENASSLVIENTAPYAEEVEAKGHVVITTPALEALKMLERTTI